MGTWALRTQWRTPSPPPSAVDAIAWRGVGSRQRSTGQGAPVMWWRVCSGAAGARAALACRVLGHYTAGVGVLDVAHLGEGVGEVDLRVVGFTTGVEAVDRV